MSHSDETQEIQRQMEIIRQELRGDVIGFVSDVRAATDWRGYVRSYPWQMFGIAAAVGYMIVPRRIEVIRPDFETISRLARKERLLVEPKQKVQERGGIGSMLFSLIASTIVRGAIAYAGQKLGKVGGETAAEAEEQPIGSTARPPR